MEIVYVGGAHGIGKTTILKKLEQKISIVGEDYCVVYTSQIVVNIAKQTYGLNWVNLNTVDKDRVRSKAIESIVSMQHNVLVLDSHYIDIDHKVVKIIVPEQLKPLISLYVLIDVPDNILFWRRYNDYARNRECDLDLINLELTAERAAAIELAKERSKTLNVIINEDYERAANELFSLLRKNFNA